MRFAAVILSLLTTAGLLAQSPVERPKLALVLSGGGAKGIAHIGVLKVLEEEGLRPDIITGTSMGSLVGGLYACGYTAAQIEQLVLAIEWDDLLTNKLALDRIAFEEKPYYGRFLVEVPFDGPRPKLPSGLIRGQKIDELFRRYTLPWHGTASFDSLAIPFACVATDVGHGRAVVMRSGLLPDAMRASMAIPTAFTPMLLDSLMLVDGGAMRNFPVSDALDMGATLVIGVSVSDGLHPVQDLRNAVDILTQATMFNSLVDDPRQAGACDVHLRPDITGFGTASFSHAAVPVLIQRGYEAADLHREQIRALAQRLPADRRDLPPPQGPRPTDSLRVDRLVVLSDRNAALPLIQGRLRTEGGITVADLEQRIDLLYGSLNFDLVNYRVDVSQGDSALVVKAVSADREKVGVSLNYDNFNQASAGVLLVSRDRLLRSSRALAEAYIARYPSVEASLLKYVGGPRRMAIIAGGHFMRGPFFLRVPGENDRLAEFRHDRSGGYLRAQTASSVLWMAGAEMAREFAMLKHRVGGAALVNDTAWVDVSMVDRLRSSRWSVRAFAQYNSTERPIYPRRGWRLSAVAGHHWGVDTRLRFDKDLTGPEQPLSGLEVRVNDYDQFQRISLQAEGLLPLARRISLMVGGHLTMSTERQLSSGDLTLIGGFKANGRESVAFWGLSEYQQTLSEFALVRAGVQWELLPDLFWQLQGNVLTTGIRPGGELMLNGQHHLLGGGTTLGLRTMLGILQVGVGGTPDLDEVIGYFNFGFRL